jgi:hypothetical protein
MDEEDKATNENTQNQKGRRRRRRVRTPGNTKNMAGMVVSEPTDIVERSREILGLRSRRVGKRGVAPEPSRVRATPKGTARPSLSLSLSLSLGVWAAPAAPPTIPEGGGAKPPHLLEWVFGAAGAAQTPTNRRFPAGPKTMCFILRKLAREIESRAPKN